MNHLLQDIISNYCSGQICVEDANPMKQTGSPKDVTAIILGVILFVFLIIAVLLFIK